MPRSPSPGRPWFGGRKQTAGPGVAMLPGRKQAGAGDAAVAASPQPPRQQNAAPPGGRGPAPTFLVSQGLSECLLSSKLSSMGGTWKRKTGEGEQRVRAVRGVPPCPIPPPAGLSTTRAGAYLYCPRPRPENLKIKPKQELFSRRGRAQRPPRGVTRGAGAGQGLTAAAAGRGGALRGAQVGVLRGRVHHTGVQRRVRVCSAGGKGRPSAGPGEARDGHGGAAAGAPEGTEGREERAPLPQPPETTGSRDTEP